MDISIENKGREKWIGWGVSIGIHVLILFIFFLIKYTIPAAPTYKDEILEIALGTDEEGWGDNVPEWADDPAPMNPSTGSPTAFNDNPNIETVDKAPDLVNIKNRTTDNRRINNTQNTNPRQTPNTSTNNENTSDNVDNNTNPTQSHRGRTFTGTGPGGNSAENNTGGTGKGNNPNGSGSVGTPGGNPQGTDIVPSSRLEGRSIAKYPPPKAKYNDKGVVKLKIWVDRDGNVTKHIILSSPSAQLSNIASQKVAQTKFTPSKTAPDPQTGTIEFNFNVK